MFKLIYQRYFLIAVASIMSFTTQLVQANGIGIDIYLHNYRGSMETSVSANVEATNSKG